jgi:hypothetical protein
LCRRQRRSVLSRAAFPVIAGNSKNKIILEHAHAAAQAELDLARVSTLVRGATSSIINWRTVAESVWLSAGYNRGGME